jgi:chaperonin GroES
MAKQDLTRYQPLANFVLLERIGDEVDKIGGIVIPDAAKTQSNQGRVIAVGEGRVIGGRMEKIPLEPGDVVLFSKYGAEEIELDGVQLLLLRHDEIKLKQRAIIG